MRLKSIRVRGLDPYITESFVDFEAVPGVLMAVTGGNGEGKSTLLNFFPAATVASNKKFLKMPKPDGRPLADLSVAKDSFLEIKYEFGQDYTVRHSINGINGKTDCSVTNGNGQALLKGKSGVTEYLAWASEHALPAEVFFGSVFSSQGTRGMLGMDPAERKAVILRVIGLERYEKLAEVARRNRLDCDKRLAVASGKLQELAGDPVAVCEQRVLTLTDEKRRADETLRLGEATVADLRAKNDAIAKERAALVTQRKGLELEEQKLRRQITELETKLSINRELMAEEPDIVAAIIQLTTLNAHLKAKQDSDRNLRVDESGISGRLAVARSEYGRGERQQAALLAEIKQGDGLIADKEKVLAAASSIAEFEESLKETEHDRDSALVNLEDIQNANVVGLAGRVSHFRGDMRFIAEGTDGGDSASYASSSLENDDKLAKDAEEQPDRLRIAKAGWQQADFRAKEIAAQIVTLRREADRLTAINAVEAKQSQLRTELAQVEAEMIQANASIVSHSEALDRSTRQIEANDSIIAQLTADIESVKPLAAKADVLAGTKARIEEMELQLVPLKASLESTVEEAQGLSALTEPAKPINLSAEEQAITEARKAANLAESQLAVAQDTLTRAQSREARRAELQQEVTTLGQDTADWKRLADDLGKDGVQALSVDAAGPELTTLANDLLRASGDTRFSLKVETTRMDSTGKREIEDCVIQITDSRKQGTKTGASGGEESYINKALAFALTMMACRHAGLSKPTIIDDEGDAALDVEYAPRYVSMLRRAAEVMDASKVIFVTHRPDSWNLADARLVISGGKVSVA